jgi:hypothetical protein
MLFIEREGPMPGPILIGVSADEKHRAEFEPAPLPDEPQVTVLLVAGAVVVALAVLLVGWLIHQPALDSLRILHQGPDRGLCPYGAMPNVQGPACPRPDLTWWERIPMTVWFVGAGVAGALVIATPFLLSRVKRGTGRV